MCLSRLKLSVARSVHPLPMNRLGGFRGYASPGLRCQSSCQLPDQIMHPHFSQLINEMRVMHSSRDSLTDLGRKDGGACKGLLQSTSINKLQWQVIPSCPLPT